MSEPSLRSASSSFEMNGAAKSRTPAELLSRVVWRGLGNLRTKSFDAVANRFVEFDLALFCQRDERRSGKHLGR